jgi:leucyl aminopeptidase (aminopeptidase T)
MSDMEGARRILLRCMALRAGETMLVVDDDAANPVSLGLLEAAAALGAEPVRITMAPRQRSGEEPPGPVASAMTRADVVMMTTTFSLSHTRARREACAAGARVASMPGITEDMFLRAGSADYDAVADRSRRLAVALDQATEARITSPNGTDIVFSLEGRPGIADTGIYHSPGDFGNLPAGEAYIAPLEGTANGTLVVDASMAGLGVLDSPLRFTIEGGKAVGVSGPGSEALRAAWDTVGDAAREVAELGIGTNDAARVIGKVLEDEKVFGTVHIAFGNNLHFGGVNDVPYHADGVLTHPTLELDGTVVIRDGLPVF